MPILKNAKHETFAHGVAKGLSATQAFIDAGYGEKGARGNATRLIANDSVRLRIDEIKANIEKSIEAKVGVSKAYVIDSLKQVAERCMTNEAVLDREGEKTGEYRFEHSGANRALELIGKELGMFSDKLKISGDAEEGPIKLLVEYVRSHGRQG